MLSKRNKHRATCAWQGTDEKSVWLQGYQLKAQEIHFLKEEISRWRALSLPGHMDFTRAAGCIPAGEGPSRVAGVAEKLVELEQSLESRVEELVRMRLEIECALAAVPDERYRLLLRMRFIDGYSLTQAADQLGYSQRHICNLSRDAVTALPFPAALPASKSEV